MKRRHFMSAAIVTIAAFFASCSGDTDTAATPAAQGVEAAETTQQTRSIVFRVTGGFQPVTRTAVSESSMTDLWVMDYADGVLVQTVHQTSADDDFGAPTLELTLGDHDLCFVASAGGTPTLSTETHSITWGTPRDTFWAKTAREVTSGTATEQEVTLVRAATRFSVCIEDALPTGMTQIEVAPARWLCSLDWLTGRGTGETPHTFTVNIPESYAGRTGTKVSVMGLATDDIFTTDITLTARNADSEALAVQSIGDVPLLRNRSTDYTGTLFESSNSYGLNIADAWLAPHEGRW